MCGSGSAHLNLKLFAILILDLIAVVVQVVVLPFLTLALLTVTATSAAAASTAWLPLHGSALQPQVSVCQVVCASDPVREDRLQLEHVRRPIRLRCREACLLAHQLVVFELI